ncbi:MAG: alpha/beta fold hydrolase [candidate division KSB1 bacterium]
MTRPEEIGCLLIHGFTSSPTEMAGLAVTLRAQGYRAQLPLLPGHASRAEELSHVKHQDWIAAVESALQNLQAITRKQIVIGQSMGGVLALHLAANFDFAAVVVLAPALKLVAWKEWGIRFAAPFNLTRRKRHGPDVCDDQGRKLLDSYMEYPLLATREVFRLQRRVHEELGRITMPLFVAHSRQDHTVPVENVAFLLSRINSTYVEKMIVQDSYHVLTVDHDRERIFARIHDFIKSVA